jgi:organic radical activating enzyme
MRISAESPHNLEDIQNTIIEARAGILVTGGEPTVPKHIKEASLLLNELDYPIANIETNGYDLVGLYDQVDSKKNIHYIYSPKLFNSDDFDCAIELTEQILHLDDIFIKVVYEDDNFFVQDYLDYLTENIDIRNSQKVWLMPEGSTRADLIKNSEKVFDACEKYKFNFSSRDHILFGFV